MRRSPARITIRIAAMILAMCLTLLVVGGAMFTLAVQQRVITPPEIHVDLTLIRIDTARIFLQQCRAPPWYCMPQDDHEADQDLYTVRVSMYTAPRGKPIYFRQFIAVRLQPLRQR